MDLGFFESDAQAKTLGRDVILYAVRKQRGEITKLVKGGYYLGVKESKGRGKKLSFSSVHFPLPLPLFTPR